MTLWNDEYILSKYGHMKVRMETKDEGGPSHVDLPSVDTIKNFYAKWMQHGYTVTQTPGGARTNKYPSYSVGPNS